MFDGDIARYSFSMTWRFLLVTAFMTALLLPLAPINMTPEELSENIAALLMGPLLQVVTIYSSLYLTLIWLRNSNSKHVKIPLSSNGKNNKDANFTE